jgi:GNAT superfamily N-acetyltransferase
VSAAELAHNTRADIETGQIRFREFRRDDLSEVLRLFNSMQRTPRTPAEWEWEFLNGPGGPLRGWVAEVSDRIIAHWAVIPLPITMNGRPVLSAKGELAIIEPAFRGRGVFRRLLQNAVAALEVSDVEITWGFPNAAMWKVQERAGYHIATPIVYHLMVLEPATLLGTLTSNHAAQIAARCAVPLDPLFKRLAPPWYRPTNESVDVVVPEVVDERFDAIWARSGAAAGTTIVRSPEFLRWRFVNSPRIRYEWLMVCAKDGDPLGYVVTTRRRWRSCWIGEIVDCLLPSDRPAAALALLDTAVSNLRRHDVAAIRFFLSSQSPLSRSLSHVIPKSGLRFSAKGATFATRSTADGAHACDAEWYVTGAFTEGIHY